MQNENQIQARVITEHKASYVVKAEEREYTATVRGAFHERPRTVFPKVGDYVCITIVSDNKAVIETVLPRKSEIVRKSAHDDTKQVMVANVDYVFIVMGLDQDFNLRRLERYLTLVNQAQVSAVIILNKEDKVESPDEYVASVIQVAGDTPVHCVSAKQGSGMDVFDRYLVDGKTGVLLGSSGAGKSTIINYLLSKGVQRTQGVRTQDDRGKHTTTVRELFALPSGGSLIDTPGMRELGFVSDEELLQGSFVEIEELAASCRFTNCDHQKSDGCAIREAVDAGTLDVRHVANYLKLQQRQAETRPKRKRD